MNLPMLQLNILLSTTMGTTKHSHHHHLEGILSPIYTACRRKNETSHTTTKFSLAPQQNIKDKLKSHMSKHHRLGDANINSDYYNYWKRLLTFVNLTTSNFFWSNTRINVSQKRNIVKFRTFTLYTQKMAHLYGRATNSSCLLCHQPDSQIHMLSGCQNASIQNMVTET